MDIIFNLGQPSQKKYYFDSVTEGFNYEDSLSKRIFTLHCSIEFNAFSSNETMEKYCNEILDKNYQIDTIDLFDKEQLLCHFNNYNTIISCTTTLSQDVGEGILKIGSIVIKRKDENNDKSNI